APGKFAIRLPNDERKEIRLQLLAARIVEGTVVRGDTGEPLPNAWLLVDMGDLQMESHRQFSAVEAKTDAKGRFQARCGTGKNFVIYVYPPFDEPYPSWTTKFEPWPEGALRKELRIAVPKGILVRGKVVDVHSGSGISGAGVEYQ